MKRETEVMVAIPTYNRARLLKDAIESALLQDYPGFHIVVLDNASTDDTEDVVRSFNSSRISYLRSDTNIGLMRNWNRAIQVNTSRYWCFLMDDDVMLPGFIGESVKLLDQNPTVAFSFTPAKYVDINRKPLGMQYTKDMPDGVMEGLKYIELRVSGHKCTIEPSTAMMRSASVDKVGPFDTFHAKDPIDLNLYFRLAARFPIAYIKKELVEVRVHPGQLSESNLRRQSHGQFAISAEQIDAMIYLLESSRANDPSYRRWLAERMRSLHLDESDHIHSLIPDLYWSWTERLEIARQEVRRIIPPDETLILVDDNQWYVDGEIAGRRAIPFVERDGTYWGPPEDDNTAIREFERAWKGGANFIVFGWPAFWSLAYYAGLNDYLNSRFRCVLKNSRMVVFDLRR